MKVGLAGFSLLLTLAEVAVAQAVRPVLNGGVARATYETRPQLEAQAALLERQGRTSDAWLRRSRLEKGDFQEGDRIVLMVEGGPMTASGAVAKDTLPIRAGKVIQLPMMGDVQLDGVLRSELTDVVQTHISQFVKNSVVRTIPLLPLAVMGSVSQPGYYYTPADVVLRDVIMMAGGPSGSADLNKVVIRRGGETIWKAKDVRIALSDGLSLDRLHLRAGDVVFVPERKQINFGTVAMLVSTAISVAALLVNAW